MNFRSSRSDHPISVDRKKKARTSLSSLSHLHAHCPSVSSSSSSFSFHLTLFFYSFYPFFLYMAQCPSLIQVRFYPEIIYFFSVQFSLNELSSSHFLTSEIFVKISSLESLTTHHPENSKNIPTVSEFNKTFLGH